MKSKDKVLKRDEQGRPTDVLFSGDPAKQCPACLSTEVEVWGGVGFLPAGNDDIMNPVRSMRCCSCTGRWIRPGLV